MVFDYARLKQRWINERVNEHQRAEAIEQLAEELEYHITESFDTLPELTITARDVSYTKNIEYHTDKITVELAPLPLEGDAEIFGEHALQGRLFGFHQGSEGDLRVYLSTGDAPRQLMGGVYTPLLSVSIDSAEIRLSEEDTTKQQYELKRYIAEQAQEYDQDTRTRIAVLYSLIEEKTGGPVVTLRSCSPVLADIARDKEVTQQVVDALLEMICLNLHLDGPHTIHASSYREVITVRPIPSYKAQPGPVQFENVIPEVGLIGETASRGMGLFFIHNEAAVQIPVQYITSMYKS